MAVPNTNTFSLNDVTMEIYSNTNAGNNLSTAFAEAGGLFDANYVGSKNSLLNFRNYTNSKRYGLLYNWYAVNTVGFAPVGWHVPTSAEISTLISTCSSSPSTLASLGWDIVLSGYRTYGGDFVNAMATSNLWGSTQKDVDYAYGLNINGSAVNTSEANKALGNSVRCIRDSGNSSVTATDFDGNVYGSVTIGTQTWMLSNLKTKHYNDGSLINNITVSSTWSSATTGAWCYYDNNSVNV